MVKWLRIAMRILYNEGCQVEQDATTYINVEEGVKRVGGNAGLYKKLLVRFAEADYVKSLAADIESGNLEGAANAAHTIKGVAANLSMTEVNTLAAALEAALKNGLPHDELYSKLKSAADITVERINSL
jgi:HPt (histidine-containing phosphotransfer) domain-containing protein